VSNTDFQEPEAVIAPTVPAYLREALEVNLLTQVGCERIITTARTALVTARAEAKAIIRRIKQDTAATIAAAAKSESVKTESPPEPPDELVDEDIGPDRIPDAVVARSLGISVKSVMRLGQDPASGFPAPEKIRGRNYRNGPKVREYKRKQLAAAQASNIKA
jgi:hypothetical protein